MSINPYLITKIWYCTLCTHHLDEHKGFIEIRTNKAGEEREHFRDTWCTLCGDNCKEFYVEAMTEDNYLIRSKTLNKWYFFYEHGYILRYHHKPTNTWGDDFYRYSDELIKYNRK